MIQRVNLTVTLLKIRCVEENDGGGSAEEVFGNLYAQADGKTQYLWNVAEDDAVSIDEGTEHTVNKNVVLTGLSDDTDVWFGGHLYEEDTGGDDDLGNLKRSVKVRDLKNETIRYTHDDTKVDVYFEFQKQIITESPVNLYVTLRKIRCVEENDGGGIAEEVFGNLYVQADGKTQYLWNVAEDDAVSIDEGTEHTVNKTVVLTGLYDDTDVIFGGHLYEEDTGSDDDLGLKTTTVKVRDLKRDLQKSQIIRYTNGDTKVDVYFDVYDMVNNPVKELSLLTYNTHLFEGSNATIAAFFKEKKIVVYDKERRAELVKRLRALRPDIVCLQEVWAVDTQKQLANELSDIYKFVYVVPDEDFNDGADWEMGGIGLALGLGLSFIFPPAGIAATLAAAGGMGIAGIVAGDSIRDEITNTSGLMVASQYPLLNPRVHMYRGLSGEDSWAKKAVLAFDIMFPVSETKLAKVTIGATHCPGSPAEASRTLKEAADLTFADRIHDCLLVGDFNVGYGTVKTVMDNYVDVVNLLSDNTEDNYTSFSKENSLTQELQPGDLGGKNRLDHICFARSSGDQELWPMKTEVFHDWKVVINGNQIDVSDHYPVFSKFTTVNLPALTNPIPSSILSGTIRHRAHPNYCLNLHGDNAKDGGVINLWSVNGHQSQVWLLN
ncbi:endonuclease/exonuclease/phosphatase family protein [Microcoleus sp.]|uniref:endonuclease/exonuclease/phosphatase family protein n=1 Tax=Microcoleus sp. TaxID=44472 RepID=UPI0035935BD5